jgi:tetratricopeptide (TPR) repeat protein
VTCSDLGKYDEAHLIYARIRKLEGDDKSLDPFVRGKIANMHADIAQAYADAGSRTEAIAELRKAVELCPTFADLHVKLGNLYRDGGDLPMASEHYATACTVNPKYVPARVLLGVTLLAMGQLEQATAEWRAALSIDPENKNAQMYLRMAEAQRVARVGGSPKADGAGAVDATGQPLAGAEAKAGAPAPSVARPPAVTQRSAVIPAAQQQPTPAPPSATPVPYSGTIDVLLDDEPDDEPTIMLDRNAEEPGTAS